MKKLYVKTQAPFIEIPTVSTDKNIEIIIGFKKYNLSELQSKFEVLGSMDEQALEAHLRKEILYIKNASLTEYDEDTFEVIQEISIADTRKAIPLEGFWTTKEECLVVLLDTFLDSSLWKSSFYDSYNQSLTADLSLEEAQIKN